LGCREAVGVTGSADSAREAYARIAPVYDEFTARNDYEAWLGEAVLPRLEGLGLRSGWALDVGCGTGRAFDPLLSRGWKVVGCDVSPEMLDEARRKFGRRVSLFEADARRLPPPDGLPEAPAGGFDLILLLNDVVNYLTGDDDLKMVFTGVRRHLDRDGGLAVFDLNTLALFRQNFSTGVAADIGAGGLQWRGLVDEPRPGMVYEARVSGEGVEPHLHRQRHWTPDQALEALEDSGLSCLAALGQREERGRIVLSDTPDQERDHKIVYVATHAA
jgi:SAM-dependent methyltransferase